MRTMMRQKLVRAALTAAILAAAVSAGVVDARSFKTGEALHRALPAPDEKSLGGTTEFTGLDSSGKVAIAIVRARGGAVLAYICDGRTLDRWLTGRLHGREAVLRGPNGAVLSATFAGRRVTGTVKLSRRLRFRLDRARKGIGLRRIVARRDSDRATVEAAWITTNRGRIKGIGRLMTRSMVRTASAAARLGSPSAMGSATGAVVFSTNVDNVQQAPSDSSGEVNTPGGSGGDAQPLLFRRAHCAVLLLRITSKLATGDPDDALEAVDLAGRFGDLHCSDFFRLPQTS